MGPPPYHPETITIIIIYTPHITSVSQMIQISTLNSLSKKCKTLNQLKQIHAHLLQIHLSRNPFAIGTLLSVAAISNNGCFFPYACSIFDRLLHRSIFMYNTMIRGYVQTHSPVAAVVCYLDMLSSGLAANNYSFPPLIKACTILAQDWKRIGRLVHAHVIESGFIDDPFVVSSLIKFYSLTLDMRAARMLFNGTSKRDVVSWTAMIDGYGKMNDVENARNLFDHMPQRNVISWSAMMAAYSQASDFREVLHLFRQMQEAGITPNESTLVSVLTACAQLGALTQGMWVHSYVELHRLGNPILGTALADMYSKCGCVESALSVFEGITNKDTGAWNAIISGVAMSGDARKSLELFHEMSVNGTQPNDTTFVAVLAACTHARLVREGLKLFEQMGTVYEVGPKLEHYACVIDLLARAGMLEEAEKFVEERIGGIGRGDANVWGALLSACRTYGNIEIGNRVWKKLADLKLADCGTHVLSYNMYMEAGSELEAKRVQSMISERGMTRRPGCSVVEVNGAFE